MKSAALLLPVAAVMVAPAQAQPAPAAPAAPAVPALAARASTLTPAQVRLLLEVLQNPAERDRFVATLQALTTALPAGSAPPAPAVPASAVPAPAPAPSVAAKPATPVAPAKPVPAKPAAAAKSEPANVSLQPKGLAARVAREGSVAIAAFSAQTVGTVRNLLNFPMLWRWLHGLATDSAARAELAAMGWRLLAVFAAGLAAEWLIGFALVRPRRMVCEHQPPARRERGIVARLDSPGNGGPDNGPGETDTGEAAAEAGESERHPRASALAMLRRLPFALLAFVLDLIPLLLFVLCAYAVLAVVQASATARLVILGFVNAYLTCRVVLAIGRVLFAPAMPRMRLVNMSNRSAAFLVRWLVLIVAVAAFGRAAAGTTLLYGLYRPAEMALLKLVMLIDHLLAVVAVLLMRRPVARRLRALPGHAGAAAAFWNFLAATWHWLAIFVIVALWLVWAFEVPNGFARLFDVFVLTAVILLAARLLTILGTGALDRGLRVRPDLAARFPELQARAHFYYPILRRGISAVIGLFAILALCQAWGVSVWPWILSGGLGGAAVWALVIILLTVLLAVLAWEAANLSVLRYLRGLTEAGQAARAARLRTLIPVIRAAVLAMLGTFAGLTVLAEIGVNIGPLLAGASIFGVAVGFGSQKLVQDFITGIFLLFENAMQVGDWVTLAGLSGTVEDLSVRTIRLRGGDGSISIIPFSSVTTVNNANRGLGNAAVSVDLDFRQDTDPVFDVLKAIGAELRKDPAFERSILGELQLWGVDKVEGGGVTIVGQIPCTDRGRWPVQREFNRRMKKRFQEVGILVANEPVPAAPVPAAGP